MRFNGQNGTGNGFVKLVAFVLVTAVLYFGKEVFVPLALASLLTFLLAPLVVRLGRWGLGKVVSVLVVVTLSSIVVAILGWLVTAQVIHLAEELPNYQSNLRAKISAVRHPADGGVISRATTVVKELQKEMASPTPIGDGPAVARGQGTVPPLPVEVTNAKASPLQLISSIVSPVLRPLATAGAVVFFVILMLLQREDLRERFLSLVSGGELNVATQAVDDAARRVSRYLLMQLIVNATYGIPIGVGLYFIGVPNAFLWGLLATFLRFIPFIGPWIAASFPILLAFAVDPGWTKVLLSLGLFFVIELISNNLVEPLLYGSSTGVSNIALLVAAIFWTWLWGPAGLLLSAPLTVCLLVLGKYVPGLSFLSVLLGSDPVLDPCARFYQRMLAMDEEELFKLSEKFVEERSLAEFYDGVVLPALNLAEQDRHKGALAEVRQAFIVQFTRDLIDSIGDSRRDAQSASATVARPGTPVLCIAARDEADELAGGMLVQLLEDRGVPALGLSAKALAADWFKEIRSRSITTVCVSGVPPFALSAARPVCKRLKSEFPKLKVLIGIWSAKAQSTAIAKQLGSSCADAIVTRLGEAVLRVESIVTTEELAERHTAHRAPEPASEPQPAAVEAEPAEVYASITRQAAKILNVPVSLVSLVDIDREFWQAHGGLPQDVAANEGLRSTALLEAALLNGESLIVEDLKTDARFAEDPILIDRGIRFFAGIPLRTADGHLVGALCVTDTEPHEVSERAKALLQSLGERLVAQPGLRETQAA